MARALLNRLTDQRGTTLVELLVAIPMALVVMGAVMSLITVFAHSEQANAERTQAIDSQQVALARMTREIREAKTVTASATATPVSAIKLTMLNGDQVQYDCATATAPYVCRRTSPPAAQPQGVEIFSVTDPLIFTVTNDTYVAISAKVEADSDGVVAVSDGAALHNAATTP